VIHLTVPQLNGELYFFDFSNAPFLFQLQYLIH
jgi:hypothetical protein